MQRRAALLAVLAASVAVFLTALDQTVVVTALPQIIVDLPSWQRVFCVWWRSCPPFSWKGENLLPILFVVEVEIRTFEM